MNLLKSTTYTSDLNKALDNIDLTYLDEKTIFITGGLGLICSAVIDLLLAYGKIKQIYVGARSEKRFKERFGISDKLVFVEYDALKEIHLNVIPDYIICGAGVANPELYTQKPVETILSNFEGLYSLLEFSRRNKVKRLLYISSSEVYGKKDNEAPFCEGIYGEIDIDNLRSSYPIAKRASEMLCKAYCSEYDVDTVIVRPGHIFGPSAKKDDSRISSVFAYKAAKGEPLVMKSSGNQQRSYCYSVDCAVQILDVLQKGKRGEAYNVSHDEVTTIKNMAKILALAGNVSLTVEAPSKVEEKYFNPMNNSALDNRKIKQLGYKDIFTVAEGLTHTVKILKETEQ